MKKLIILFLSLMISSTLFAGQIKQIVILGDSLSDNGNLYHILKIVPKSPPYFEGRFTNGPTWAELLGKFYYDKSFIETENYAVGGATSILHSPIHDSFIAPFTLTAEVYDYLARSLFINKANILYIIWIGANDYLYENEKNTDYIASSVVNNISWTITTLINQGARHFVIMNLPDLSRIPYAKENHITDKLYAISQLHNKKLNEAFKKMKSTFPQVQFIYIDIYAIFNNLLNNTNQFNKQYNQHITDLTNACWQGPMMLKNTLSSINTDLLKMKTTFPHNALFDTNIISQEILNSPSLAEAYSINQLAEKGITPCENASEHIFWDQIHPTEVIHQTLATIVEQNLIGLDI